jgi:hypothetical protein
MVREATGSVMVVTAVGAETEEVVAVTRSVKTSHQNPSKRLHIASAVSPNKTLQRSGTHKLLGRGRPVSCGTHRPAELCR